MYGRYREAGGLLSLASGMLIATDRRVIFLDHKPGFTSMDELTYDVVSGVKVVSSGLFSSLILHTRLGDYTIRFANSKGIANFVHRIESNRLERSAEPSPKVAEPMPPSAEIDAEALAFLKRNEVGVLSTVDRTGNVHGATIYYTLDSKNRLCFVTKASTQKARDMFTNQQVAMTIFNAETAETVQMQGLSEVVHEPSEQQAIFYTLIKPRDYSGKAQRPPVTTIHEDSYVVLRISPTAVRYRDYKKRS